ncbi:MAG: PEP-utilizing enzyme [Candidatus Kerfeldbacteria bacterium]
MNAALTRMIKKTEWYRQGGAITPWYVSPPWSAISQPTVYGKNTPSIFGEVICIHLPGNHCLAYWKSEGMRRVARDYLERQCRDHTFVQKLHRNWERRVLPVFKRDVTTICRTDLRGMTNVELESMVTGFMTNFRLGWSESIFHDAFDLAGSEILEKEFVQGAPQVSPGQLDRLLMPTEPLIIQRERIELSAIASRVGRGRLRRLVLADSWATIQKEYASFYKRIETHRNAWKWMMNDYEHVVDLPINWFTVRIRRYVTRPSELRRDRSIPMHLRNVRKTKRALMHSLKLTSRQRAIVELLSTVQVWRDERKAMMTQYGGTALRHIAQELSRRFRIPLRLFLNLFVWELHAFMSAPNAMRNILRVRKYGTVHVIVSPSKKTIANGKASIRYERLLRQMVQKQKLHGMTAFSGVVRGKAHFMLTQSDFPKFKPGEILIAPNTRPEYVPIMKKAAGIVTEEGGITSHAAIVSRELRIPAIVGVQGILEAVKNGDRVEVDAVHGIVRKL